MCTTNYHATCLYINIGFYIYISPDAVSFTISMGDLRDTKHPASRDDDSTAFELRSYGLDRPLYQWRHSSVASGASTAHSFSSPLPRPGTNLPYQWRGSSVVSPLHQGTSDLVSLTPSSRNAPYQWRGSSTGGAPDGMEEVL